MAKSKPTKMLAVLGRCRRGGRWQPAARSSVLAVLGDCHLDMRNALVEPDQPVKFQVTVFLGAVTFIVPPGVEIRPSGMSILASSQVAVPTADETSFPLIEVEWTCILGRVRIIAAESAISEQAAVIGAAGVVGAPAGTALPQGMVMPGVAQPMVAGAQPMVAAQPMAAAQPMTAVQPMAAQPASAAAVQPVTTPGVGFDNLGDTPSPYGAAPAIPTLTEAMAAVPQVEPIPSAIAEEPAPGGFLDFGNDDLDDSDANSDTDSDSSSDDDVTISDDAPLSASRPIGGSGPPSQEVGFADILAGAG